MSTARETPRGAAAPGAAGRGDPDVQLRRAVVADLPAIATIEHEAYSVPWSESTFRGLLRRRDAEIIVAVTGEELVGYAAYWHVVDQGELGNVAVTAAWRRRGLGERLVRAVMRAAARRGLHEIFLEVRPSNRSARRLYDRLGFQQAGRRRNYYQEPVEDALVLRRPMTPADGD